VNNRFINKICEKEMANMVSSELWFNPINGLRERRSHDPGIIYKDVDRVKHRINFGSSVPNRCLACKIQLQGLKFHSWADFYQFII
jgi:hypothetical protein